MMLSTIVGLGYASTAQGQSINLHSTRAELSMDDTNNRVIGLDSSWMYNTSKESNGTWHTAKASSQFGGQQTVKIAPINTEWAEAIAWDDAYLTSALDLGSRFVYNNKLYAPTQQWPGVAPTEELYRGWRLVDGNQPVPTYTFEFTRGSEQDILAFLDGERARLMATNKVFSYLPSWGSYVGHEYFDVDRDIDYKATTHLTYSFVKPIDLDRNPTPDQNPPNQSADNLTAATTNPGVRFDDPDIALNVGGAWNAGGDILNRVKKNLSRYEDKYFVFSVGGWTYSENQEFENATRTPELLEKFAKSLVDFMVKYGFDGVDIDWEYPLNDKAADQFLALHKRVRELMTELSMTTEKYYTLSTATTPNPNNIQYIRPAELVKYVDTVNYMAYDYHGGSFGLDTTTNHNAPLYEPSTPPQAPGFWIDNVIQEYIRQGVPNKQLMMGVAYYSRSWVGVPDTEIVPGLPGLGSKGTELPYNGAERNDLGGFQQNTGGMWGNGSNPYYRMLDLLRGTPTNGTETVTNFAKDYVRYWDPGAQVPYLYSKTDKIFHTYDDVESIGIKVNYILDNQLAGAIVWDLTGDTRVDTEPEGASRAFELSAVVRQLVGQDVRGDATLATSSLPNGRVSDNYSAAIVAVGEGPITFDWEVQSGRANWLNITDNGARLVLTGTPDVKETFTISVSVKGATGVSSPTRTFNITIVGKNEEIPPPGGSTDKETPTDDGGNNGWVVWVAIIAAVLVAGGAVALVIFKKKSNASSPPSRPSNAKSKR
jgi:chitinase